jgi:glucose-6-phosphate dehydrogenase assembly protein OpcA
MTTTNPPTPLGERTNVDVRAVERELTALWKQVAEGDGGEKRAAVTRTCVLNLVVMTGGTRAAQHATDMIARLTARHPNRAIVVSAAPDAQEELLDAWVQAHCQMPGPGRPQVCCEQITIEARGGAVARVPGTVLPLLVPDVPVMLWWPRGEPFADPLFTRLHDLADRLIVDTATFAAPEAGLARMESLLGPATAISDLTWTRLTPWRELIAQFFDVPAMAAHLAEIAEIAVDYELRPGEQLDRTPALLLVGWLSSRLGWRSSGAPATHDGVTTIPLSRRDGGAVQVVLRPAEPKEDALDRLAGLTLRCPRAHFHVGRHESPDAAVAWSEVEGMQTLRRIVRLERLDEAGLLAEEVRLLGRDRAFEGALQAAAALIAQL